MTPPKKNSRSRLSRATNSPVADDYILGLTCTLVKDPADCYILGGVFASSQVLDTLSLCNWPNGTQFETRSHGSRYLYEVRQNALRLLSRKKIQVPQPERGAGGADRRPVKRGRGRPPSRQKVEVAAGGGALAEEAHRVQSEPEKVA